MRYFLDTEFNGFGGALIAMALVPEDPEAQPFYEAAVCTDPTAWVKAHVLPVLNTVPIAYDELTRRFADYLADDDDPVLIADWPEDIALAARALISGPGRRHKIDHIRFELCDPFDGPPPSAMPHNAYYDALALRDFMLRRERR
jgi:hypothetical protein